MKRYSIRSEKMPAMSGRSARSAMATAARAKANAANASATKANASAINTTNNSVRRTPYSTVHNLNLTTYLKSKKGKTMKNRIGSMFHPFRRSRVSN